VSFYLESLPTILTPLLLLPGLPLQTENCHRIEGRNEPGQTDHGQSRTKGRETSAERNPRPETGDDPDHTRNLGQGRARGRDLVRDRSPDLV
jgi:hypothetical protein